MKSRILRGFGIFAAALGLLRGATALMDADIRQHDREERPREERLATAEPVPKECADGVSADTGQPVMLTRIGALTWGVSTKPARYGQPIPVLLWIDNPTNEAQYVTSCSGIAGFSEETEIFDSSGRRMFRFEERRKRNPDFGICTSEYRIEIPAHTCLHGNFSNHDDSNLRINWLLQYQLDYELLPGEYILFIRSPDKKPLSLKSGMTITVVRLGVC